MGLHKHTRAHTVVGEITLKCPQVSLFKEPGAFVSIRRSRLVFRKNKNTKKKKSQSADIFFLSCYSFLHLGHEYIHG